MKLNIHNVNKVKEASIQLNGLSVIVGENSTGKSTVGRVLFSTIKALANTMSNDGRNKNEQMMKHVSSLYKRLFSKRTSQSMNEIEKFFPRLSFRFVNELESSISIDSFIDERIGFIDRLEFSPRQKALMRQDLENIRKCKVSDNLATQLSSEIQYLIESEFLNKICSNNSQFGKVSFIGDDDGAELEYEISESNLVKSVSCSTGGDFFQDATYIESPLYLHMQDALRKTYIYRELEPERVLPEAMIPLHIKDVVSKMDALRYLDKGLFSNSGDFHQIIKGEFIYDKKSRSIVFSENGTNYSPINVASGIKSFGILQILLDGGFISGNRILIWDEPENHLHPQWQIEFAKILVMLADSGIPILISTHSPYFLQAIRFFSAGHAVEKYVNVYLAEEKEDGESVLEDVTKDLSKVFAKLAKPLNNIMNVDMQRMKTMKKYDTPS